MAFEILTADQLIARLKGRKYKWTQVHHTWKPNHASFDGTNHIKVQQGMYNSHVHDRGWDNIGQHVSLFPDGKFVTGRPFNSTPAGITGYNTGAFMTEMVGNFDKGNDKLEGKQLEAMLKVQNYLVKNCGATIMFHNEHSGKTCPGTGINKKDFVAKVNSYGQKPVVSAPAYPGYILKNGTFDDKNVGLVQKKLGIKVDNDFGSNTEKYVKAWQKANGLADDGKVGPATWKKMFN